MLKNTQFLTNGKLVNFSQPILFIIKMVICRALMVFWRQTQLKMASKRSQWNETQLTMTTTKNLIKNSTQETLS